MGDAASPDEARERALRFIDYRPRSTGEVRTRLARYGYPQLTIESVIERLVDAGILDDGAFASLLIAEMVDKGMGVMRVRAALAVKRVDRGTVEEAMEYYPSETEQERAVTAARRKIATVDGDLTAADVKRLVDYLRRRGFTARVARDAAREAAQVDTQSGPELEYQQGK